jgi:Zn-dependent protease
MLNLDPQELVLRLVVVAMLLLVSLPFHEFSHALAAYRLGDSTARFMGRLTLDPRVHFDPVGGLMLLLSTLAGGGFGWAKPTPVNPFNLRYGQWGDALVAAAGPLSNLVLAIAAAIPLRFLLASGMDVPYLTELLAFFVLINLLLMVFNFIPIPPLDGLHVLYALIDRQTAAQIRPMLDQYGPFLLLLLILLPSFGVASPLDFLFSGVAEPLFRFLVGVS